ncbi:3'-5' exonuclease [Cellulomonas sp.]|uniref:3'-5' exonuclease n=1 Tax=Cellulomonas sp. TaxID=40001 RepID=UPI001B148DFB|nr:3'-5' exonuclease [Cellulomonas sp.]MBO9553557.1 3'-5' exonuclease [Cellulomonas sp.]
MGNVWWEGPLAGIRLETTGTDVETARIVTAEVAVHHANHQVRIDQVLVDPGVDIPDDAARELGITTAVARSSGMPARDGVAMVLRLLAEHADLPLVVSQGVLDLTVLDRELRRHGCGELPQRAVIDPMVLDKHLDPGAPGRRSFGAVARERGVRLDLARTGDVGAMPAIRLARALGRTGRLPADAHELHRRQVRWHSEQVLLEQYVSSRACWRGEVSRQWPVLDVPLAWTRARTA